MKTVAVKIAKILSLSIIWLLLTAPASVFSQTASTGALAGTVSDSNGAVVPDAQVKVINEATGESRTAMTQGNGGYLVPLLPPGSYQVEISKSGFKSAVKTGLRINVTETTKLDVRLEVGEISSTVTITADAELLQTETASLGHVTSRAMVSNLPLVSRNYLQIINLSPGVASEVNNASALGRGGQGDDIRTHGSFARDTNIQMNGVQINDLQSSGFFSGGPAVPNPDAIEEFKVQTGLYDASNGRNAGAVVNVVTRSGSNKFHGSLFEFFRNDVLNANSFFRNRAGQPRGVLRQNQFGGTFGGPIKKDRLHFFGSYQGMRQLNGLDASATSQIFLPPFTNDRSRAALGRLFAGQCGFIPLALTGSCAGAATVAADGSNISPQALALLNLKGPNGEYVIPSPQVVSAGVPFGGFSAFSIPAKFDEDQFIANFDYQISSNSQLASRFFFANSEQVQPIPPPNLGGAGIPGFPLLTDNRVRNYSLAHTHTFNPNLINQAQFGFHRINVPTVQQEIFKWSDIGVNAPPNANPFPEISVQGSLTLGGNGQGLTISQDHYNIQDLLTYIRGRHTLRAGGGVTRTNLNLVDFHFFGGLIFGNWADLLLGRPGGPVSSGGSGLPFGNILASIDIPGILDRNWRVFDANAYLQDDIRLTPSLSLFLGVRYERLGNLADENGRNSGFDIRLADPNPPATGTLAGFLVSKDFPAQVPAGVTQLGNNYGVLGKNQNNVGPRVGFAWQLPRTALPLTRRMVLRGGYGMYFSRATGQPFIQLAAGPPFASQRLVQFPANTTLSFANPFGPDLTFPIFQPYSPTTSLVLNFVDPDYRPPITQQYSFNIQTDLGKNMMLEVGYVGTKGTHLILAHSLNQAALASPSKPIRGETTNTFANVRRRVPILGFAPNGLGDIASSAFSRYDGLEVSLTKRLSSGLQLLAAYTFAHAYSNGATNTTAGGGSVPGDQVNNRANYGRSDFNREHRFVLSYIYFFPSPARFNAFVNTLLGGWAISGVTTIQSGRPLTLTGTNAANIFGITNDRAQLAPGCTHDDLTTRGSVHSRLNNYFNKSCIARNAAGSAAWPIIGDNGTGTAFGNSGVGIVFGPGQNNSDMAVLKRTPVRWMGEGGNIEFRAEFFNAFNHTQFANPNTNVSAATFGVISATSVNPRIIQFALKLGF
ncbi:MAG TPA: carboxypeptidase regulatory-like domain-containing protein [Blastocatellia bacterium]|nr:carboxypeptidase regulatory-like domain-containing protein [Blastocatellia bacterium]